MLNAIDVNPNNQNPKKRYSLNTLYCRSLDVVADKFPKLPITELNTTLMHVLIVLIITFIALFHFLFSGYKTSKYGNRLTGIENVQISDETINASKEVLKSIKGVTDVSYHLSGKICNFILIVDKDANPDTIMKEASKILEKFSTDEKKFYDFQILVKSSEDSKNFPIIGYKINYGETFTWTGKVVEDEE